MGENYVCTTYFANGTSKPITVEDVNKAFVLETTFGVAWFFADDSTPLHRRIVSGCIGRNDCLDSVTIAEALDVARDKVEFVRKMAAERGEREDEFSILCDATKWFLAWAWNKPSKAAG